MPDNLQAAAEAQLAALDRLVHDALKTPKRFIRILVTVCALLVVGGVVLGWYAVQQNHLSHVVQAGSIASCEEANQARAANAALWNGLLNEEVQADSSAVNSTAFKNLKAVIAALPASDPDTAALQQFFQVAFANTSGPALSKEVQTFKSYIAAHEKPQNCSQTFGRSAAEG